MTDDQRRTTDQLLATLKDADTPVLVEVLEWLVPEIRARMADAERARVALMVSIENDPLPGIIAEKLKRGAS